ncbi:MAG TPA: helix-turn-helix domain-containing protein [Candidatus Binataceae bacterium]|nr:helix-turn-helix domain-containing protein [Candidatus Binataceae bacterium]
MATKNIELTTKATGETGNRSRLITVRELAAYLRVHPTTVYRLLRQEKIPSFRVGSDWRFDREAIERWMSEKQVQN